MRTIGQRLAAAREERGLSIEDISRSTRVRGQLLRQIEADDFAGCGGTVYARGHVRNVANAVGLDPAPLLADFDELHGEPAESPNLDLRDQELISWPPERNAPNWTAAMAVAAAVLLVVALVSVFTGGQDGLPPDDPPPVAAADPTQPAPGPPAPRPPAPVALAPRDGVAVRVRVTGNRSWIVAKDGNRTIFQGQLSRGAVRDFRSRRQVDLVLGNAGAVSLVVNGRDLGTPGVQGEVVRVSFGPGDPSG